MEALRLYLRSPPAIIGLLLLLIILAMAASAGWLYPRDPLSLAGRPLVWPLENPRFLLGTDNSGRDIAAQIFHGARFSLLIGGVATLIAIVIGIVIGTALLQVLQNLVNLLGIDSSLNFAVMGAVVRAGVLADQWVKTRATKKGARQASR